MLLTLHSFESASCICRKIDHFILVSCKTEYQNLKRKHINYKLEPKKNSQAHGLINAFHN